MKAELKRLVQNLGELAALADDLEKLKSIEQAEQEAQARIAAVQREADGVRNEAAEQAETSRTTAQAELEDAREEAARLKSEAKTRAEAMISKAEQSSAELVRQAEAKCADAQARQDAADRAVAEAELRVKIASAELETMEQRLAEVRAMLAPLAG